MKRRASVVLAFMCINVVEAFLPLAPARLNRMATARPGTLPNFIEGIPQELEGILNPEKEWEVELELNGVTKKVLVQEGTSILEAAEMVFDDPPNSCRSGVCTTCAGRIVSADGGHGHFVRTLNGLGDAQHLAGFTLTCQTYPTGPGLKVLLDQSDNVIDDRYVDNQGAAHATKFFGVIG